MIPRLTITRISHFLGIHIHSELSNKNELSSPFFFQRNIKNIKSEPKFHDVLLTWIFYFSQTYVIYQCLIYVFKCSRLKYEDVTQ